jgi:hypothetical protein
MIQDPKPFLDSIKFTFGQEEDTSGRSGEEYQTISVEAIRMDEPKEGDTGCYFVMSTERWAVNDAGELSDIILRVERAITAGS